MLLGDVEVKGEVVGEGKGEVVGEGEVESVADMSRLGSEPSELLTVMMVGRGLLPTLAGPEAWTGGAGGASPGGGRAWRPPSPSSPPSPAPTAPAAGQTSSLGHQSNIRI